MGGLGELAHCEDRTVAARWKCLAGDTRAFGFKIAFIEDPDGQQGVSADIAPSWGAFQIWVNGQNLCSHWEEGERVESAHWYLLPLLEWFARHREFLLHEERLPCEAVGDAWTGLHGTRFPPPGLDEGDELAWDADSSFRQGTALFDRSTVAEPLYDALEKAAAYLSSIAPWSSRAVDLKL